MVSFSKVNIIFLIKAIIEMERLFSLYDVQENFDISVPRFPETQKFREDMNCL